MISSPDDLFKIGFQDVDYQKLGLAELKGGRGAMEGNIVVVELSCVKMCLKKL